MKSLVKWTAAVVTVVALSVSGVAVPGIVQPVQKAGDVRADIITIDTLKGFGELERPAVQFLHTRHTEALAEKGKDCQACHLSDGDRLSVKFKRLKDASRQAVMDTYHLNCIACHTESASGSGQSGPVTCGECHRVRPITSNRIPMAFDKSLHYRHAKAADNKCEACHHDYDAKAKKLFYAKGKEGSCRYCHKAEAEENRISMRLASHLDCIDCHRRTAAAGKKAGPATCVGCHAPEKRQLIEKVAAVPRMDRKQPDVVLIRTAITTDAAPGVPAASARMAAVPFNHKGHEQYNDTCRVCHHADLSACGSCHTQTGDKKGKHVTLEQAMHRRNTRQSCIGCHEQRQQEAVCAACHAPMSDTRQKDDASCRACHMPAAAAPEAAGDAEAAMREAQALLASRSPMTGTYDWEAVPEKVVIKTLVDQYDSVDMPHRKIVRNLVENIRDNPMAQAFHPDRGTVCQGCHHNSPATEKPPLCGSCHGKPFDDKDIFKPGLMAAYHRQCMACHETMGIAKPDSRDCTACHLKKKDW